MFAIGDQIIYGSTGVCTVTDIAVPDIPGADRKCYILKPHYMVNSKIYAPVEGNPIQMRLLLTPSQAQALIDDLPQISAYSTNQDRQELYNTYRDAIRSADCLNLAKLIKTLHDRKSQLLKQRKNLPSAEKDFFDTAQKMLHGEIAATLQIPFEDVDSYISDRLQGQTAQQTSVVS